MSAALCEVFVIFCSDGYVCHKEAVAASHSMGQPLYFHLHHVISCSYYIVWTSTQHCLLSYLSLSLSLWAPPPPPAPPLPFVAAIMIILITVQLLCGICLSIPLTVRPSLLKHKSGISHICSILVQTADLEETLKKGTSRPHLGVEHYSASLGDWTCSSWITVKWVRQPFVIPHSPPLPCMSSIQDGIYALGKICIVLHPLSQKFPQYFLWNGSSVNLSPISLPSLMLKSLLQPSTETSAVPVWPGGCGDSLQQPGSAHLPPAHPCFPTGGGGPGWRGGQDGVFPQCLWTGTDK